MEKKRTKTSEVDDRMRQITGLVVNDNWRVGESEHTLARDWGVTAGTVLNMRSTVLRAIRGTVLGKTAEELRTDIARRCDRLYRIAIDKKRAVVIPSRVGDSRVEMVPDPDVAGAVRACHLHAHLAGLLVNKVEARDIRDKLNELSQLTDEEFEDRKRRLTDDDDSGDNVH